MDIVFIQMIVSTLLYFCIFVCGFAISIPVGVTTNGVAGCILYGELESQSAIRFILNFSPMSNCDFPMYCGVFVCIIYAFGMGVYNLYTIYKSKKDTSNYNQPQMLVMAVLAVNSLATLLMFVSSCIVSAGFRELCDSLTQDKPYQYFSSCEKAQNQKLVIVGTDHQVSAGTFYTNFNVTQAASWICTFLWLALVISGVVRFKLSRRMQTRGGAPSA